MEFNTNTSNKVLKHTHKNQEKPNTQNMKKKTQPIIVISERSAVKHSKIV